MTLTDQTNDRTTETIEKGLRVTWLALATLDQEQKGTPTTHEQTTGVG